MSEATWGYKGGESRLFAIGEAIPDGWMDSPDPERGKSATRKSDVAAALAAEAAANMPSFQDMTKAAIATYIFDRYQIELDQRHNHRQLVEEADEVVAEGDNGDS